MNRLPGHKPGFAWQGSLLITWQDSRGLSGAAEFVIAG